MLYLFLLLLGIYIRCKHLYFILNYRRQKNTTSSSIQITPTLLETSSRRAYRTKASQSDENSTSLSQNTLKLNRRPGRWQYKSSPKPKVNIRKATANATKPVSNTDASNDTILEMDEKNQIQKAINLGRDLDAVGTQNTLVADDENKSKNFVQTLNVEISTPSNFEDVYYEIATIKSPFIFQVIILNTCCTNVYVKNGYSQVFIAIRMMHFHI